MKAAALRELLACAPDDAEICCVGYGGHLMTAKHAHLVTFRDGSGGPMVAICPAGQHLNDRAITIAKGAS